MYTEIQYSKLHLILMTIFLIIQQTVFCFNDFFWFAKIVIFIFIGSNKNAYDSCTKM